VEWILCPDLEGEFWRDLRSQILGLTFKTFKQRLPGLGFETNKHACLVLCSIGGQPINGLRETDLDPIVTAMARRGLVRVIEPHVDEFLPERPVLIELRFAIGILGWRSRIPIRLDVIEFVALARVLDVNPQTLFASFLSMLPQEATITGGGADLVNRRCVGSPKGVRLREPFRQEIPRLITDEPKREQVWVEHIQAAIAAGGYTIQHPQLPSGRSIEIRVFSRCGSS
jgi:hypothetical protein